MSAPRHGPVPLPVHAAMDAILLGMLAVSPWVLGYAEHVLATAFAVGFAVMAMGMNFITDYPLGLWRKLPMKWHRLAELAAPPVTIVAPWVFFADAGAFPWVATVLGLANVSCAWWTRPLDS